MQEAQTSPVGPLAHTAQLMATADSYRGTPAAVAAGPALPASQKLLR
jgi:hypothetical protein